MDTWRVDNQMIYPIAPLEEYLAALDFAARCEGEEQRLVLAIGDSGTGKTVGARIFCRESEAEPLYIRVPARGMLTPRGLLQLIAEPLGLASNLRSRFDIAEGIADGSLRRPRVLVFDEAQAMANYDLLDMIRWLHDEGGHVFALVGVAALDQAFLDHRQFGGRVALRHQLRLPTVGELAPLFEGFPSEALEQIHRETGGRMRQVMALRRRLRDLISRRKLGAADITATQVRTVGRHFLVRAA